MKGKASEESLRWLKQAESDLDDARYPFEGKRYNTACFMAQQSAEKVIKAYLYYMKAEEVWGHSAGELCENAMDFDKGFKKVLKYAYSLDKFYILASYPNSVPGGIPKYVYTKEDAQNALKMAAEIMNFVKEKMNTSDIQEEVEN